MRLYAKKSVKQRIEELEQSIIHPKELTVVEAIEEISQLRREIALAKAEGGRLTKELEKIRMNQRE